MPRHNYEIDASVCNIVEKGTNHFIHENRESVFERKECFSARQFRSFDRNSVRIKGTETLYLPVVHPKQATQVAFT